MPGKITHGLSRSRIYKLYRAMKNRCYTSSDTNYYHYGAKGVRVCKEWKDSFMAFHQWSINNGYNDALSIDRINNNKGYSPKNCRWVNMLVQRRNQRSFKLSMVKAIIIRKLKRQGINNIYLAKKFGVSTATISYVLNGQIWMK